MNYIELSDCLAKINKAQAIIGEEIRRLTAHCLEVPSTANKAAQPRQQAFAIDFETNYAPKDWGKLLAKAEQELVTEMLNAIRQALDAEDYTVYSGQYRTYTDWRSLNRQVKSGEVGTKLHSGKKVDTYFRVEQTVAVVGISHSYYTAPSRSEIYKRAMQNMGATVIPNLGKGY